MIVRTAQSRHEDYLRRRKPRQCRCGTDIPLGSRKRLCDVCRETPDLRCKKCKQVRPISRFSQDATRPSGLFPWCMDCQMTSTTAFQNPDDVLNGHICALCDTPVRGHANRRFCSTGCKDRVSALRKRFGLEVEDYRRLVADTGGRCPICRRRATQWHVDHDHSTGRVTGVVCGGCNVGPLAYSLHSVELVERLLAYVRETPAQRLGIQAIAAPTTPSSLHKKWQFNRR